MAVVLADLGLAYVPVPKNACTALKEACWRIATGGDFVASPGPDGRIRHIHDMPGYGSIPFGPKILAGTEGLARLAVVRHPFRRLISCHKNRVLHYDELSDRKLGPGVLAARGLLPRPAFDVFIERLADYRAISPSIRHHTDLQSHFLGPDPGIYAHVFRIGEMAGVAALLSRLAGRPVVIGRRQTGGSDLPDPNLIRATRDRMRAFAAPDFQTWGAAFGTGTRAG